MDVMQLRRGLMMGMGGSNIIKGTFTPNYHGSHVISFGRTISRYIAFFEMTEESKDQFAEDMQTLSVTANRLFGFIGARFAGCDSFASLDTNYTARYNGTTVSSSNVSAAPITVFDDDHIEISCQTLTGNANTTYKGYTYNYMIIPIE